MNWNLVPARYFIRSLRRFSSTSPPKDELSHIRPVLSPDNEPQFLPCMVDVSNKAVTARVAHATGKVILPPKAARALGLQGEDGETHKREIIAKKGPVFATAIVAGVMAVKKTSELIPFCHPIPIDRCDIDLRLRRSEDCSEPSPSFEIAIDCVVQTSGKTGVEMEALVGVSNAALCVYDMLKAVSHDIRIADIALVSKKGGKSDFTSSQKLS